MTLKEKVEKELPGMIVPETGLPLSCPGYYRTVRLNDDRTLKNCKQILFYGRIWTMNDKAEYAKDYYNFYKSHHICVKCRQERALNGLTLCWRCRLDVAESSAIRWRNRTEEERKEINKKHAERSRRLREERKMTGVCVVCGKRKPKKGRVTCEICLAKRSRKERERRIEKGRMPWEIRIDGHHCYRCMDESLVPGKKLCPKCYEQACTDLKKARRARMPENDFRKAARTFAVK